MSGEGPKNERRKRQKESDREIERQKERRGDNSYAQKIYYTVHTTTHTYPEYGLNHWCPLLPHTNSRKDHRMIIRERMALYL